MNRRGRNNRKRRGPSSARNCNQRHTKQQVMEIQDEMVFQTDKKSPIPVVLLTPQQSAAIASCAMVVELVDVERKGRQILSRWRKVDVGEDFSTKGTGHIVTTCADVFQAKVSDKKHPYAPKNFRVVGDLPGANHGGTQVMLASWNTKKQFKKVNRNNLTFGPELLEEVEAIKPSCLKQAGVSHHKSHGCHYGYGSHASYDSVEAEENLSSVRTYARKSNVTQKGQRIIGDRTAAQLDEEHKEFLEQTVDDGIEVIISAYHSAKGGNIVASGAVINKSIIQGGHILNPGLKKNVDLLSGHFPAEFINEDAATEEVHTECDSSLTLIFVPWQEFLFEADGSEKETQAVFEFHLLGEVVQVEMGVGMAIFFSGFFLPHRQVRKKSAGKMINVSTYGSKPFFDSMRQTVQRQMNELDYFDVADNWIIK